MLSPALKDLLRSKTILVVDDEPDSLAVAQILLEMYEVNVITAMDGSEGLEKANEHLPSFIISDLSMPVMSGWEMLKNLKEDRRTLDIPVVALTAHAMTGDRDRAIRAGFHNYLTKPLRPETFIEELLRVVMDIPGFGAVLHELQETQ